jgi:hypothetical protein
VFHLPHTKRILLSDLEVFEVRDVGKSGLVIGVADKGCETMVYRSQSWEVRETMSLGYPKLMVN